MRFWRKKRIDRWVVNNKISKQIGLHDNVSVKLIKYLEKAGWRVAVDIDIL